jgi:hypothetical protein
MPLVMGLRGPILGSVYRRKGRIGGFALRMRRRVVAVVVVGKIAPWWVGDGAVMGEREGGSFVCWP